MRKEYAIVMYRYHATIIQNASSSSFSFSFSPPVPLHNQSALDRPLCLFPLQSLEFRALRINLPSFLPEPFPLCIASLCVVCLCVAGESLVQSRGSHEQSHLVAEGRQISDVEEVGTRRYHDRGRAEAQSRADGLYHVSEFGSRQDCRERTKALAAWRTGLKVGSNPPLERKKGKDGFCLETRCSANPTPTTKVIPAELRRNLYRLSYGSSSCCRGMDFLRNATRMTGCSRTRRRGVKGPWRTEHSHNTCRRPSRAFKVA